MVEFEWDPNKAASNLRTHGVRFAEAAVVLEDDAALSMRDDRSHEERFVAPGMDSLGRILVVVTQFAGPESELFRRARPRGGSDYNTRENTDEKGIRFR